MNKTELITYIADNSNGELTKKQATQAVDLALEAIETALKNGDKVQLVGYLTIEPVARAARKGFNPQTKEEIDIPASMGVKTKPGKALETAVEGLNIADFLKPKKGE